MTGLSAISHQLSAVLTAWQPGRLAAFYLSPRDSVTRAVAIGVVAGMRSQLPLALLALAVRRGQFATRAGAPVGILRSPIARGVLGFAAIGELIADKLPFVPNRNEPGPLFGRLVFGGIAGVALALEAGGVVPVRALAGATAAGLAAIAAYHLRATVDRVTGLPDPLVGAVEDLLAIALGLWAIHAD